MLPCGLPSLGADQTLVEPQQLGRRQPTREAEELGQVAERSARLRGASRVAQYFDPAGAGPDQAAGDLRQRRLAGAVRTQQADQLTGPPPEVDPGERVLASVALG